MTSRFPDVSHLLFLSSPSVTNPMVNLSLPASRARRCRSESMFGLPSRRSNSQTMFSDSLSSPRAALNSSICPHGGVTSVHSPSLLIGPVGTSPPDAPPSCSSHWRGWLPR